MRYNVREELGNNKHGYIIQAVLQILKDGRSRNTDEILEAGQAAGTLPQELSRKSLYIHIVGFIDRQRAAGRPPRILQDPKDRSFRLNVPSDGWPEFKPSSSPPSETVIDATVKRLQTTACGEDPAAFELAACEAFRTLGMLAVHIGGYMAPDASLCAPLGVRAYTATLECEIAQSGVVKRVGGVVEAAQHRDTYHADHAILLGPDFEHFGTLDRELHAHGVGLWTVDDLACVLRMRGNLHELHPLFVAGRAANKIPSLQWERQYGEGTRIRTIARILIEEGWKAQVLFATQGSSNQAPLLTEDAAMLLVDGWLQHNGATSGATRDEVRFAMSYLTNPLVRKSVHPDDRLDAIIVTQAWDLD